MGAPPEGLRLTSLATTLSGGERVVVVPGSPGTSKLVRHVEGRESPRMPFDGPPYLSGEESRVISDWVAQGAPDEAGRKAPIPVGASVRLRGTLTARWALDGQPFVVGPDTRVRKNPRIGESVEVRGRLQGDGSIRATRVRGR
jgi:hypothetical protein